MDPGTSRDSLGESQGGPDQTLVLLALNHLLKMAAPSAANKWWESVARPSVFRGIGERRGTEAQSRLQRKRKMSSVARSLRLAVTGFVMNQTK
ncbi:uncharacterized [Tachysurus ichikawai]